MAQLRFLFLFLCVAVTTAIPSAASWNTRRPTSIVPTTGAKKSPLTLHHARPQQDLAASFALSTRGGWSSSSSNSVNLPPHQVVVKGIVDAITTAIRTCLPPVVAAVKGVVAFYKALPHDAIVAQVGLVYCFCGGYYPTLFAALQAAQNCGLQPALNACKSLVQEAQDAIQATRAKVSFGSPQKTPRQLFQESTRVVMSSIDPAKINQACGALYTTWLGIEVVLQKEFARTINYALSLGSSMEPFLVKTIGPPIKATLPEQYHQWVPITLGWITKFVAMQVVWRIQKVITASTSAVIGGLLFSRSLLKLAYSAGYVSTSVASETVLDEIVGYGVAAAGLYTQLGDGTFNPKVKFPFTLLTWPFEIVEDWMKWQITNDAADDLG